MDDEKEKKFFKNICESGLINPSRACDNQKCKKHSQPMSLKLRKINKDSTNNVLFWRCSVCRSYRTVFERFTSKMYCKENCTEKIILRKIILL